MDLRVWSSLSRLQAVILVFSIYRYQGLPSFFASNILKIIDKNVALMKVKTSDVPLDQTETGTPHRHFFNLFYFKFSFSETS